LIVRQLHGEYRVKHPGLKPLYQEAMRRISRFRSFRITHVPRERNKQADRMVNAALNKAEADPTNPVFEIHEICAPREGAD